MKKSSTNTLVIVHFSPLERYPPVMNLIRFLESKEDDFRILVFTTSQVSAADIFSSNKPERVQIIRKGFSGERLSKWKLLTTYLNFNWNVLLGLLRKRPFSILYFETISSFSPLIYKLCFNKGVLLLTHYHEYLSKEEYRTGMKQLRFFNWLEEKIYSRMYWISHTNEKRLELFLDDNKLVRNGKIHVMPNYPPSGWLSASENNPSEINAVRKFVLVGSLSLTTMFTKEFANWIKSLDGKAILDIYSFNISEETRDFFKKLDCKHIRLLPSIDYYALPGILRQYDVGLILYKGYSKNVTYSVSNKLFEYHVCGLDVWFSHEILGSLEYITTETYPQIKCVNFTELWSLDIEALTSRQNLRFEINPYQCEPVLENLYKSMKGLN